MTLTFKVGRRTVLREKTSGAGIKDQRHNTAELQETQVSVWHCGVDKGRGTPGCMIEVPLRGTELECLHQRRKQGEHKGSAKWGFFFFGISP